MDKLLLFVSVFSTFGARLSLQHYDDKYGDEHNLNQKPHPTSQFSHHEKVIPELYSGNKKLTSTYDAEQYAHEKALSIRFSAFGTDFLIDLHLNSKLLGSNYIEKYYTEDGKEVITKPENNAHHCYYHGRLRGLADSSAALSTCNGISGIIIDSNEVYHIWPSGTKIDGEHLMFRDSDQFPSNKSCGHKDKHNWDFRKPKQNRASRMRRSLHWPYDANEDTKVVELYIANDYKQYLLKGRNVTNVISRTKEVVNIVNSLFRPLNIYIALVGVEIWTKKDKIIIASEADETMEYFLDYRKDDISPKHPNDNAQLITGHIFDAGVVGKAPISTICSWKFSGGVNMDHSELVGAVATTVAHEMGHNFGLNHDSDTCHCPEDKCIMAPSSGGGKMPTHWSECSLEGMEDSFHQGLDYCLHNLPASLYSGPVCGNSFLEEGEECDCGLPEDCSTHCCDANTCRLMPNSTCATGKCCDLDTCQVISKATLCRGAATVCDLPEHCDGITEFCPSDVFLNDGEPCDSGEAYCYSGMCRTQQSQCEMLWGKTGTNSHRKCYTHYNVLGNVSGHCGFDRIKKTFERCTINDSLCGMLFCDHKNEKLMFWPETLSFARPEMYIQVGNQRYYCRGAILDVGLNQVDPGMVPNGAKCGDDKVCLDQKCVPVQKLLGECPDCNNRGVCNSLHQCHCDAGFAPPLCDKEGDGGSIHGGPITIKKGSNRGLVVGLCVFFLLILPVLCVALCLTYKYRKQLRKAWCSFTNQKSTADKYRSIYRAKPRNDTMTTPEKAHPQAPKPSISVVGPVSMASPVTSAPTAIPPTTSQTQAEQNPRREVKKQPSFRPEDISKPKLNSSTNKSLNAGIPLAHGTAYSRDNSVPSVPPPRHDTGLTHSQSARSVQTRPSPGRPLSGPVVGVSVPADKNVKCGGGRGGRPGRPPPPNVQRSHSSAGQHKAPDAGNPTPSGGYENISKPQSPSAQFQEISLNSPTSPTDKKPTTKQPYYANDPQEFRKDVPPRRPPKAYAKAENHAPKSSYSTDRGKKSDEDVAVSKGEQNASRKVPGVVTKTPSRSGKKPVVSPKPKA